MLELPSSDYDMMIPAGLVLTGGGANLNGIATLGRDMLQMPVRAGIPNRNVEGITDALMDPSYATSVGLLLSAPVVGLAALAIRLDSKEPDHHRNLAARPYNHPDQSIGNRPVNQITM